MTEPPEPLMPPRVAPGAPHCGPRGDGHCLVLELHHPEGVDVEALVARMRAEGLRVDHRDALVTLSATDAEALSLFEATVVYRWVARSSGAGWRCSAYLQQPRVPARYREQIRSVQVGHQLCE